MMVEDVLFLTFDLRKLPLPCCNVSDDYSMAEALRTPTSMPPDTTCPPNSTQDLKNAVITHLLVQVPDTFQNFHLAT